ncbi:hypothetical protein MNBD_ALPHA06-768 [hydrothermal vent metagenome]|uniref:Uncharacterized protein n=1 Tax=hydrothermal vent metagenome TaxID=652676 RepID=A0A3B0SCV8_9ZZZZ
MSVAFAHSKQEIDREVTKLARGFSIEILAKDANDVSQWKHRIPARTAVYIAQLPDQSFEQIVDAALKLQQAGVVAVPHLAVRKVSSKSWLRQQFTKLQQAGVQQILVIAGDRAVEQPVFSSSFALMQTGWLEKFGFTKVGIAGHPEGLGFASKEKTTQILLQKCAYAKQSPAKFHIVTQFGLEPQTTTRWEQDLRQAGVTLDIHAGMAGRINAARLLQFAVKCGVGSAVQLATKSPQKMLSISRRASAEKTIQALASYRLQQPDCLITKVHFFPFGSFAKTLHWASRL